MRLTRLKCFFNKRVYVLKKISKNRLSISTFNCGFICEHLLFVRYKIFFKVPGFHNTFSRNFLILITHKPSMESGEVPHKIWARSVQPFWRLLDTNKQTDRHPPRQTSQKVFRALREPFPINFKLLTVALMKVAIFSHS